VFARSTGRPDANLATSSPEDLLDELDELMGRVGA
jgi:hypothetical protein